MQQEMSGSAQKELLLEYCDQLRLAMAGNLAEFKQEDYKVLSNSWREGQTWEKKPTTLRESNEKAVQRLT